MGFRILDRMEQKRIEEHKKIVTDRVTRKRRISGGTLDIDELKLQKEFLEKVHKARNSYAASGSQESVVKKLKELIISSKDKEIKSYLEMDPDVILELL